MTSLKWDCLYFRYRKCASGPYHTTKKIRQRFRVQLTQLYLRKIERNFSTICNHFMRWEFYFKYTNHKQKITTYHLNNVTSLFQLFNCSVLFLFTDRIGMNQGASHQKKKNIHCFVRKSEVVQSNKKGLYGDSDSFFSP